MAGPTRLQSLADTRYALDFSTTDVGLFRYSPTAHWEELARAPLQLGQVAASMRSLRTAARASTGHDIPVEVWLPEDQLIVKPITTGGVPPVRSMIEHAFATASSDGLSGITLDENPVVSGPMHIYAGIVSSVIEEAQAFLATHRFRAIAFTRPEPPAGIDHVPVILPPRQLPRPSATSIGRVAAAGIAAVALFGGGLWASGLLAPSGDVTAQSLDVITDIQQVSVAPDDAPALLPGTTLAVDTTPTRVTRPEAPVTYAATSPGFAAPSSPRLGAQAQETVLELASPLQGTAPLVPVADSAPGIDRLATVLYAAASEGTDRFTAALQTAIAAPDAVLAEGAPIRLSASAASSVSRSGFAPLGPAEAASVAPDLSLLRSLALAIAPTIGDTPGAILPLREIAEQPATPIAAAPLVRLDPPGTLTTQAQATADQIPALGAIAARPETTLAAVDDVAEADVALPDVTVIAERPALVPPLRPTLEPQTIETADEIAQVVVIAARPDIVPPPRLATSGGPELPAAPALGDSALETPLGTLQDTPLETPVKPDEAERLRLAALPPAELDIATPPETGAEVTTDADRVTPQVLVLETRPDVVPPLRPRAEPATDPAIAATQPSEDADVLVIAARPDVVPPLRPAPTEAAQPEEVATPEEIATPETAETDALSEDLIAALISEAGDIDLSPSANVITSRAPPRPRPAAIEQAETERLTRLAALAPSDRALDVSPTPRSRPAGLAGSQSPAVPTQSAPATTTTAAATPAPAPSTRRVPQLPSSASVARAATIDNALPLRQLSLIGVYGKSGSRQALLRMPNGRYVKVKSGDRVDGFDVAAISADAIRLRKRGRDTLLVIPE